jgi:hypothetical protein
MDKLNQVIPYLWGIVVVTTGIITLYFPSVLQGIILGFSIGMLVKSIFANLLWGLIERYRILTEKLLEQNRKLINLKVRK